MLLNKWRVNLKGAVQNKYFIMSPREQWRCAEFAALQAFNKTRIMLIFLKQCCSLLAFKAPRTLSSWENGKMVVLTCGMTYKDAKLHVIMFNTTFQWAISFLWNSRMVFLSLSLQALRYYRGICIHTSWAAGKGSYLPHVISSEASENTIILPRSVSSAAFALDLYPAANERVHAGTRECVSEWGFVSHLKSLLAWDTRTRTHTVITSLS